MERAGRRICDAQGGDTIAGRARARDVPARDQLVPFATGALRESEDFVKTHNIVSLPAVDYKVIEMPEYARGASAARRVLWQSHPSSG